VVAGHPARRLRPSIPPPLERGGEGVGEGSRPLAALLLAVLLLLATALPASAQAAHSRDVLWGIVTNCLDTTAPNYCTACTTPRTDSSCGAKLSCQESLDVWAETRDFVAVRDRKMCGCPAEFVHAIAVPRARVTGVEDPHRPDGIWSFAWAVAEKKIPDASSAALAINPARMRSQDQMHIHIHILRLKPGARDSMAGACSTRLQKLDDVWKAAAKLAASSGLADYGVLVAIHPEGGFLVVVDPASPEKDYAQERCH